MSKDAWNPLQYEKFKDERSQPFFDLMALLQTTVSAEVVDLGCGTWELTKELHQRLNAKVTVGVDSSEEMLKRAIAHASDKLIFKIGNIENWSDPKSFDEWVKGTLLTHFKSRISEADYNKFLIQFRERLFERIPDEKPFFYPFKRILIWGRL